MDGEYNNMKSDFLSMYVQLATAHAITTGQGNAIFRLLSVEYFKKYMFSHF